MDAFFYGLRQFFRKNGPYISPCVTAFHLRFDLLGTMGWTVLTEVFKKLNRNLSAACLVCGFFKPALEFHAQKGHMEQLAELDNRFHDIMYEACDSKLLEHQLKDFHQYVLRVRRKTLAKANRGIKSNAEHKGIMEAIKAGNGELAEKLAHQHMINAYENMVENGLKEAYDRSEEEPARSGGETKGGFGSRKGIGIANGKN